MNAYFEIFGRHSEVTARAPGRVNLLGEHTDYNEGYVLPMTIPQQTTIELGRAPDHVFQIYTANFQQWVEFAEQGAPPAGFASYVHGCIEVLRRQGMNIPAVSLFISSDVPIGSGLSSSASLEVCVLRGLRQLFGLSFDDVQLALFAQRAEIEYAGVNCGVLDQMACSLGQADHLLFLDTRTLARQLLPLPPQAALVIIDSGVSRELTASAYNQRRRECQAAADLLGVKALRDITDASVAQGLPAPLNRRVRHVITENERVLAAVAGVSAQQLGVLMNASHASLRDDYQVSIPALDRLVDILQANPAVYGARLTGAGFGGACVALVNANSAGNGPEKIKQDTLQQYSASGYHGHALV